MAGSKQPIELVLAKGKKHLTKSEIDARKNGEIQPLNGKIEPPEYLNKAQRAAFRRYARQLKELGVIGVTDVDVLARYVVAEGLYELAAGKLSLPEIQDDHDALAEWNKAFDMYGRQCRMCANDLGLSPSSRCKLVIPKAQPERENRFSRFGMQNG